METLGKILVWLGNAVAWCWSLIGHAADSVWGFISAVIGPVASPLLGWLDPVVTILADSYYTMFDAFSPVVGLIVTSGVVGVAMLIVFRCTSNQAGIAKAKDAIKAELLAIKLYKDDLRVMFGAQGRLFVATLRLQGFMIVPMLVMLLPMLLLLAQMGTRYQQRPLRLGERTLLRVVGDDDDAGISGEGFDVEVGPIAGDGDLVWRVRATEVGAHTIHIKIGDDSLNKSLVVGKVGQPVSVKRPGVKWTSRLLHPRERPIVNDAAVKAIMIEYPELDSWVCGTDWWFLTFFVVSMVTALILKPVFRVKF